MRPSRTVTCPDSGCSWTGPSRGLYGHRLAVHSVQSPARSRLAVALDRERARTLELGERVERIIADAKAAATYLPALVDVLEETFGPAERVPNPALLGTGYERDPEFARLVRHGGRGGLDAHPVAASPATDTDPSSAAPAITGRMVIGAPGAAAGAKRMSIGGGE